MNFILAAVLYFISHLLRALRLWITTSNTKIGFSQLTLAHLFGNALGNFIFPWVKDLGVLLLLSFQYPKFLLRIFLALIYNRLYDICVLLPLIILVLGKNPATQPATVLLLIFGLSALVGFTLLSQLCEFIQIHFLRHHHHQVGLLILQFATTLQKTATSMKLGDINKICLLFINTGLIWITEALALWVLYRSSLVSTLGLMGQNVLLNSPFQKQISYAGLYVSLAGLSLLTYAIITIKKRST